MRLSYLRVVIVALAALAALTTTAAAGPAAFDRSRRAVVTTSTLTLITGDTVAVTAQADGKQAVSVVGEAGTSRQFKIDSGPDGDLYVYPDGALTAVATGSVDRELFNVTRMLEEGHGDARSDELPAIVDFQGTPAAARLLQRSEALPGSESERVMPRLGLAAVDVEKSDAERFWRAVTGSAGVAKVWYDGQVEVALDQSVPQIGAPEAWAEGYDGTGVDVAVLDTGADLSHPDIASEIVASQSFITGQTVQDGHGHGTHVASTIAGSGAVSGGKYKGVAPGADLLVGKVIANNGVGPFTSILAGMEWAVAQGADVVNMSLGIQLNLPGPDVLTQAVDSLSASSGTLFVIAAGNRGPGQTTLDTPGDADSALTVGAVDRSDVLASFSGRGPRIGDSVIKPDITAPGVGIVAARAAGTTLGTPVDANYTASNGTSMATPHVSGAAAILAQRHPDWPGRRIKEALTAHSKASGSDTVYQQGYGRVDIPAALNATLELAGAADYGLIEWHDGIFPTETRTLTFRNTGTADATLAVTDSVKDSSGNPVADGVVTVTGAGVSGGTLTVPAGGTAVATVALDPNGLAAGQYSGYVTATAAGGESVHTPVGFVKDIERHNVTVTFKDRFGSAPGNVSLTVHGMDNTFRQNDTLTNTASRTYSLPVGRYSIEGALFTLVPGDPRRTSYAVDLFALPEIVNDQDQTQTVDAATATDFTVEITGEKRPLERAAYMTQLTRDDGAGGHTGFIGLAGLLNGNEAKVGAVPSQAATTGTLRLHTFLTKREPLAQLSVTSPEQTSVPITMPVLAQRFQGTKKVQLVDAGTGSAEDFAALEVEGKAVLITTADLRAIDDQARRAAAAGAVAMIAATTIPGPLSIGSVAEDLTVPVVNTSYDGGQQLLSLLGKSEVSIALEGVLESGYTYSAPFFDEGRFPDSLAKTVDTRDFVRIKNTFHSDRTRRLAQETLNAWGPGQQTSVRAAQYLNAGDRRDDYVLASPLFDYQPVVYASTKYNSQMFGTRGTYETPGKTLQQHWFAAPMRLTPLEPTPCNFCRSDVWVRTTPGNGGDSDPTHQLLTGPTKTWTYFRNGQQFPALNQVMVPGQADYRFVLDLTRAQDFPGVTLGGKVRTEWSFTSAAPTTMAVEGCEAFLPKPTVCESMPVVMLDYDVPVDPLNRADAGLPFSFTVHAGRPKGWTGSTEMAGANVSVSYDDGATWSSAEVLREDGNSFQALVLHPELAETNGFVTVKAEVWDSAGNRTIQTINRAYALE